MSLTVLIAFVGSAGMWSALRRLGCEQLLAVAVALLVAVGLVILLDGGLFA
jgi:hypothetical protein